MGTCGSPGIVEITWRPPQLDLGWIDYNLNEDGECVKDVDGFVVAPYAENDGTVNGVVLGLFSNVAKTNGVNIGLGNSGKEANGVQLGLWNNYSEKMKGVGVGIINESGGDMSGFQVGLANAAENDLAGFQVGFNNVAVHGSITGFQVGFTNVSEKDLSGFQVGFVNAASVNDNYNGYGNMTGFQISVFSNVVDRGGDMTGFQVSIIGNFVERGDATGLQGATFYNVSNHVNGLSIGLINQEKRCRFPITPMIGGYCVFGGEK